MPRPIIAEYIVRLKIQYIFRHILIMNVQANIYITTTYIGNCLCYLGLNWLKYHYICNIRLHLDFTCIYLRIMRYQLDNIIRVVLEMVELAKNVAEQVDDPSNYAIALSCQQMTLARTLGGVRRTCWLCCPGVKLMDSLRTCLHYRTKIASRRGPLCLTLLV